jgi:hypothetical protein
MEDAVPEYMTVREVARILRISEDSVLRKFVRVSGVIDLSDPPRHGRRPHRVLRIPRGVLARYLHEKRIR